MAVLIAIACLAAAVTSIISIIFLAIEKVMIKESIMKNHKAKLPFIECALNRLFGKPEEINGGNRCPTYLYRWHVLKTRWFKAYIHHFVGDDWSLDLHDHPKRFISIGLWGWYREFTPHLGSHTVPYIRDKEYHAPWIHSFPAHHIHRIATPSKSCWTFVIVLKEVRKWGFWHDGKFIPWRQYVDEVGGPADKMKACD